MSGNNTIPGGSEKLIIRPFIEKEFGRLAELNETTYKGREVSDPGYLEWEYLQNPDGRALISTGEIDGKVVSQYIVLPRVFSVDGKKVNGSLSVNTITSPEYRGKGFFEKLANYTFNRCSEQEILFTIGFPNPFLLSFSCRTH